MSFARNIESDPLELAKASLQRPDNYAYWGDKSESGGWGRAFGQSRDSDALERSNFEVITTDMLERFPDDFAIERDNHWAVGWVETGRVRVLKNPDDEITLDNLTDAFHACLEWKAKLDNYPVANEEHFSELEWREFTEFVFSEAPIYWREFRPDDEMPVTFPERFANLLSEDHSNADDLSGEDMTNAARLIIKGGANYDQ